MEHAYLVTFLACPKKGDPKKGTRRKFLTPCSVVLGTFRKLALRAQTVRNASPSDSVAWLNFRMGTQKTRFKSLPQPRTSPERIYEILGHPSWPKVASRRANAHCLRPTFSDEVGEAEFARSSGRGLRRVQNFVQAAKGMCKKHEITPPPAPVASTVSPPRPGRGARRAAPECRRSGAGNPGRDWSLLRRS